MQSENSPHMASAALILAASVAASVVNSRTCVPAFLEQRREQILWEWRIKSRGL